MVRNIKEQLAYFGGEKSLDFKLDYVWPVIKETDIEYLAEVVKKHELSFNYADEEVRKLEDKFSSLVGCDYSLALNSGTSALHATFMAIGLKKCDKVAIPSYTFPATVMPLLSMGIDITFIDTEEDSPRLSVSDLRKKVNEDFKCIVVAHLDGIASDMPEIKKIADENKCFLIEDCAQALGSNIDNSSVGSFGDVGIFSLQQKKLIASGEGGVLTTSNRDIYEKAILYCYLQKRSIEEVKNEELSKYAYTGLGYNFRIHPLSAALANCQLSRFDDIISKRVTSMKMISDGIDNLYGIKVVKENKNEFNSYYTLKIIYKFQESIVPIDMYINLLEAEGVYLEKSLTVPLHKTYTFTNNSKEFFDIKVNAETLDNCEQYSSHLMRMLPYYDLEEDKINKIINAFKKVSQYLFEMEGKGEIK